jgi:predicted short-subunit dehydrogenase-like oxidoreductase (DUF2520 family)
MRIAIVGPGRAGMSLALAAHAASHDIVAVVARDEGGATAAAERVGAAPLTIGSDLPACDLIVIATRDDAIEVVADAIAPHAARAGSAVHLSGLAPVERLRAFADRTIPIGAFHPLQTLPTPEAGAARLAGAWIAVTTADTALQARLERLARSLGAKPFPLADDVKPLYHAAAAAAANFPLVALTMASDLFESAGVPFAAAQPLVEAVVANAFDIGPRAALTGPVARGDDATVTAQLDAVHTAAPEWLPAFAALVGNLASLTGRTETFDDLLQAWRPPESE